MAKAYYFDYTPHPELFKNSTVEADTIGSTFAYCVYSTLGEYGVQTSREFGGPAEYASYDKTIYRLKAFIVYDKRDGMLDRIDISLTADNRLLVDFKFDPFIPENSNDEIIADIRTKAVDKGLIGVSAQAHTTNSSYTGTNSNSMIGERSGCYVATAVYGSYDCPEVWTLRRFRDYSLAQNWCGRVFIKVYYAVSPTLVKWFGRTAWFNKLWRGPLDKLVSRLKAEGYDDSPYND